jgi:hypothetical protein
MTNMLRIMKAMLCCLILVAAITPHLASARSWPTNYTVAYNNLSKLLIGSYSWPHTAISNVAQGSLLKLKAPGTIATAAQVLCICTAQPTPDGVFTEVSGYGYRPSGDTFLLNLSGNKNSCRMPQIINID